MIKLVASDIDGTLVKESSPDLSREMIEIIQKLKEKGILFVAASGRQYHSIRHLFHEVADDIAYIAENGAHIVYQGKVLSVVEMERKTAEGIIADMRSFYPSCELLVSTTEGCYMETDNSEFIRWIDESYHNKFTVVEDVLRENLPIIKASLYQKGGIRDIGESILIPKWETEVKACMAGEEWVDFMDKTVDKGHALRFLQSYLHISHEETMAFGDNNNDVGMMGAADQSYAVENAVQEVREKAKYSCAPYYEHGVYRVLKELVDGAI